MPRLEAERPEGRRIGQLLGAFTPTECANHRKNSGPATFALSQIKPWGATSH